jgi:AmmeMemoRadiSam system protein B
MHSIRKPAVAGQFYAGTKNQLIKQINTSYLDSHGPGSLPEIRQKPPRILGIIVPHAGYIYSGPIAAHAYHFLANHGFADIFIIIGPNHTGSGTGVSLMTKGSWQTPLGETTINTELAQIIYQGIIDTDTTAHLYEHSLEVQLPFLQHIAQPQNHFDIIPICMMMQDTQTSLEIGQILANAIQKSKKNIVMIASSDFSHVGFNYNTMPPPNQQVDEYATTQDHKAIKHILNIDPEGLIQTIHTHKISMCGYGPVAAVLTASKILKASEVNLLKYGTSYEVHPSTSCVGYAALTIT